jgi:hypothetical protein
MEKQRGLMPIPQELVKHLTSEQVNKNIVEFEEFQQCKYY